jgi:hypothetical protein
MPIKAIELKGLQAVLELSKITSVRVSKRFIHLDELEDGSWRLTYNPNQIPDLELLQGITLEKGRCVLEGIEQQLDLKVVAINTTMNLIHFDEGNNGKWKLLYNSERFPEFGKLTCLEVIREN